MPTRASLQHRFQLIHYGENGGISKGTYSYVTGTEAKPRQRAGALAKKIKGPVDIAVSGSEPWSERYITTAAPSALHARGFRFERIG